MRKKQKYNFGGAGLPESVRKQRNEMFADGFLWCSSCEQFRAIKEFYKGKGKDGNGKNYGYRYHCARCNSARWLRNKEHYATLSKKRNSALSRQWAILGGGECQRCKYDQYYSALSFHHIYPGDKKYEPAQAIITSTTPVGYKRCWQELDKCCLLCANCHLGYEARLWRAEFIKRDGLGWAVGGELPLDDNRYNDDPPTYQQAELLFDYSICRNPMTQLSLL